MSKAIRGIVTCIPPPADTYWMTMTYSSPTQIASISDYECHATAIGYFNGRVSSVTYPATWNYVSQQWITASRQYAFTQHPPDSVLNPCGVESTNMASVTDERAGLTEYAFDTSGRLVEKVDQLNRPVLTQQWNNDNRLDWVLGAVPNSRTTFQYDAAGNVASVEDANLRTTAMEYDALNNLTLLRDALLQETTYQYADPLNPTRVTLVNGAGSSDIQLTYGSDLGVNRGHLTQLVSANNVVQTFDYDLGYQELSTYGQVAQGTTCKILDSGAQNGPTGAVLTGGDSRSCGIILYPDLRSNLEFTCSPTETICLAGCDNVYDADGHPVSTCQGSNCGGLGYPNLFSYDGNGAITQVSNAQSTVASANYIYTTMSYDARGRMIQETVADQGPCDNVELQFTVYVDPDHSIQREYSDSTGRTRVTWSRTPCNTYEQRPNIVTEYFTDLAGRVTQVFRDGALVAQYTYEDSTVLPAVTEYKPVSGMTIEHYVDAAGNTTKVVHLRNGVELAAFEYTRDGRDRIGQVEEYQNLQLVATTTYTYGAGNLTGADLDPVGGPVDPNKLYWDWIADYPQVMAASDPNRLIKEERSGDSLAYRKEYWYDPGGNRLAMRHSTYNTQTQQWEVYETTRYNYLSDVDYGEDPYYGNTPPPQNPFDASVVPVYCDSTVCTGEPTGIPVSWGTDYNGLGRDMLLSYNVYRPSSPDFKSFALYWYGAKNGRLSTKVEHWTHNGSNYFKKTTDFSYYEGVESGMSWPSVTGSPRGALRGVKVQLWSNPNTNYCAPGAPNPCPDWAFGEVYAYDWQGRRIAKLHCGENLFGFLGHGGNYEKCPVATMYDYDGDQLLVERQAYWAEEIRSSYAWGPLGLINRTAERDDACTANNATFDYLSDATGHCVGIVGAQSGEPPVRFTRMDAWGNQLAPLTDDSIYNSGPNCPAVSGTEILTAQQQYHGHAGYDTDMVDPDRGTDGIYDGVPPDPQWEPDQGRSTKLIHIGERYYEPLTGRFVQHDSMPIDPLPLVWGQDNRWTYAANDPVNGADRGGFEFNLASTLGAVAGMLFVFGFSLGFIGTYKGSSKRACFTAGSSAASFAALARPVVGGGLATLATDGAAGAAAASGYLGLAFGIGVFAGALVGEALNRHDNPPRPGGP